MTYDNNSFAVCYNDAKLEALFFPRFLPLYPIGSDEILADMGVNTSHWLQIITQVSIGAGMLHDYVLVDTYDALPEQEWDELEDLVIRTHSRENLLLKALCWELGKAGYSSFPVFRSSAAYQAFAIHQE